MCPLMFNDRNFGGNFQISETYLPSDVVNFLGSFLLLQIRQWRVVACRGGLLHAEADADFGVLQLVLVYITYEQEKAMHRYFHMRKCRK